ncbi:TerC/Alx family metal homeostasis membrane protein [Candidatus Saccharibacteria bacterium]|nr:TerC/Alx family metal homeostasis membrane protein [Candidatus Saccharibacteria bacterium]MBI3338332.1 TerC/Alx family metal homeostasis membrane protein [Candidatus Saccharibacteria bacterium]
MFSAAFATITQHLYIPTWHWAVLIGWFTLLISVDLLLHRRDHSPTIHEAIIQSLVWIGLGIGLGLVFWPLYGASASTQYFSGYLIEKSLSIDNVFAWSVLLTYFKIPKQYQHRVLFWGVFGALILRAIFIFAGVAAIERFEPSLLIFGGLLLYSGYQLLIHNNDHEFDPETSKTWGLISRFIPYAHKFDGHNLFTRVNGKRIATILFMALLAIELTDVIFAIDSVPAILAVSRDPFIVFSSNAAAILGLRALYFVFDHIKERFWLLNKGLGIILIGVGIKMIISPSKIFGYKWLAIEIPTGISLLIIAAFLTTTITLSWLLTPPAHQSNS